MGFTPLEGILMGTRSGSIDPAIIFYLEKQLKMKPQQVDDMLNKESGLKGLSEISSDMRNIYAAYLNKNEKAVRTIETLSYQIARYIGAYAAAMNGLDVIIFTGGLGEKAFYIRKKTCEYLQFLGVKLNEKKNEDCEELISEGRSKVKVFNMHTNEERQIAKETVSIVRKK